jgi:phage replication O-like protein O
MANPQIEDGHIVLANEIVEQFCKHRISGEEWLVLWTIIRKTYGWKKKEDRIALSQFAVMTGLKRQTVLRAINKLSSKKIIAVIKNDDSGINIYSFNKNFDQWAPLSKKITVSSKKIIGVIKKDNCLSSKKIHTKETITKETITKEIILPAFIKKETLDAFIDMRSKIKKPITDHAVNLLINKLSKLKEQGYDPEDLLNDAIMNSWQGIVIKKQGGNNGTGNGSGFDRSKQPAFTKTGNAQSDGTPWPADREY